MYRIFIQNELVDKLPYEQFNLFPFGTWIYWLKIYYAFLDYISIEAILNSQPINRLMNQFLNHLIWLRCIHENA